MPLEEWTGDQGITHPKILVYGASGAGKTRFASTAPKPLFADAEKGMASIQVPGVSRWPIEHMRDWGELKSYLMHENDPETGFQTLVIDSLNEVQRLLLDFVLSLDPEVGKRPFGGQPNIGDYGYSLNLLQDRVVRWAKDLPMNVIFICSTAGVVGSEGRIEPALIGKNTVAMVTRYMDVVGYMYVKGKESQAPEHNLGFHLPHAVSKDRSARLPASVLNPTWDKLETYWSGATTAPAPMPTPGNVSETASNTMEETLHVG